MFKKILLLLLIAFNYSVHAEPSCTINSIHDGDTARIICEAKLAKLRLYCIDAPELQQKPYGKHARDYLRELLPMYSSVSIAEYGSDRYGRTIGEIFINNTNINLQLVKLGYAAVYPEYCTKNIYYQAQSEAQSNKLGIWQVEGLQTQPWEFRRLKRLKRINNQFVPPNQ